MLGGRTAALAQKRPGPGNACLPGPSETENSVLLFVALGVARRLAGRVTHAADGVLHLASGLLDFAFGPHLLVAGDLADGFLHAASQRLGRTFDAILIHRASPLRL